MSAGQWMSKPVWISSNGKKVKRNALFQEEHRIHLNTFTEESNESRTDFNLLSK